MVERGPRYTYCTGDADNQKERMIRPIVDFLYGSTPAEFPSSYPPAEAVERLRAATKRSAFSALAGQAAVGKVTEERVSLQRVIPLVNNGFKPFFVGQFQTRNGTTVLVGRFGMTIFTKVFMTFWLGMVLVIAIGVLLGGAVKGASGAMQFAPFLMFGAGLGLIGLGKWFARNDVKWLTKVISEALAPTVLRDPVPAERDPLLIASGETPLVLKIVAVVLAIGATLALVTSRAGAAVRPPLILPSWVEAGAIFELLLAVGVWRRSSWAWRGGFILIGVGAILPAWSMVAMSGDAPPLFATVLFGLFSLIVAAVWGRWWYGQRRHFDWT